MVKVVAKPIQIVTWSDEKGYITPVRFRYAQDDGSYITIRINKVINRQLEKLAGNHMWVYTCNTIINNVERIFVLKYEISTCKWMLFKI